MHEQVEQLLSQLKMMWRYRWYALVFAWVIAFGGWTAVYLTPDRYEASARVHADTQTVLRPLLTGLAVQPNLEQMVTMMSRTLISRPNLEKVIKMADTDIALKTPEEREQLIARLSKELTIKSAGSENLYTISYSDRNPQQAKRVVQSLLTLFMEGGLGDKRKDSESARRFIDEQLKGYNEKLLAAENAISQFKRRNLGLMTGEAGYFSRLAEAKAALSKAALELREAENSRDSVKKQLAAAAEAASLPGDKNAGEEGNTEIDARIRSLEQKLDSLRLSYTEQHPDIVAILPTIARLKEQRAAEAKLRGPLTNTPQSKDTNPIYQQLTVSLTAADATVAAMKARVAEYNERYAELQAAVNAVPQVEAEYTQLTRDYEVNKARYDELLKRRDSAQMSGDMEASDAAMGFRVIDPPQVPHVPSTPTRRQLMSMVLLAALAGGVGMALLISQIRPSFNDERKLREVSGLPVLGTVIMAWTDAQKTRRTGGLIAFILSLLSLLSAYVAIMATLTLTMSRV